MSSQQADIEKTLKRILARELEKWPDDATFAFQDHDKELVFVMSNNQPSESCGFLSNLANDHVRQFARQAPAHGVTRAEWEAERALLASEQAQPVGNEEEFDQALWDKVAFQTHEALFKTDDGLALGFDARAVFSFDEADAFMAERAKRIAARKSIND